MKQATCDHFNNLARELQRDPQALEKQFYDDMRRMGFVPVPKKPEPMDDTGAEEIQS